MKKILYLLIIMICSMVVTVSYSACEKNENSYIEYKVNYVTDGNGTIQGDTEQQLKTGEETSEVTAVPNDGYKFVKWSDENTDSVRTDIVEDKDLTVTAIFEKCKFTVTYLALGGGIIEGEANQVVEYGEDAQEVKAVPERERVFREWIDGSTNPVRHDTNVKSDINAVAYFDTKLDIQYLTYETDGNGTIQGQTIQQIVYDNDGSKVTAIPNDGYEFVKWSDGVTTAERQDLRVQESKTITAQFKRIYVRYSLNYKFGEADTDITEYKFYDNDFKTVKFPVPTREHFTFEGWYIGNTQVTNTSGEMLIGEELLQSEEKEIYAKWTANENYTYKILIVYVTEVNALIPVRDGNRQIQVNYIMSEIEKQICQAITRQLKNYLDDMLDGLVEFEVDEYFTVNSMKTENISIGSIGSSQNTHIIMPKNIPEIDNLLENYQSVLTSFSFNDYDYELHNSSGLAYAKYGAIHFDTLFMDFIIKKEPIENLLDMSHWGWNSVIDTYIHELSHTIEMLINSYDYHSVLSYYQEKNLLDTIEISRLYFNKQAIINGEKVGIPIEFWSGEMELKT